MNADRRALVLAGIVACLLSGWSSSSIADEPAPALEAEIDRWTEKAWEAEGVEPAGVSSDAEFFRRLHLDLAGVIPSAEAAREFLADTSGDKRERAIERLLASPDFARHFAGLATNWLIARNPANRVQSREPFRAWLESKLLEKAGWDAIARDVITASGDSAQSPATLFHLANGPRPDALTSETSRVFLGVQVQCAQCHDHPFTEMKRDEFWGLAAFYTQVQRQRGKEQNQFGVVDREARPAPNDRPRRKQGKQAARSSPDAGAGTPAIRIPEDPTRRLIAGRFLDGTAPPAAAGTPFRKLLADWMTSRENPYFAKALVNRVWDALFGRGLVMPVDDMIPSAPCTHPELLEVLAKRFAESGYDLRFLFGAIARSRAYQLSSRAGAEAAAGPEADPEKRARLFGVRQLRPLSPEQLYDSMARATGAEGRDDVERRARGNARRGNAGTRERVIGLFASMENPDNPSEREWNIPVALFLMNGPLVNRRSPALERALSLKPEAALEALYLGTLSRFPEPDERAKLDELLDRPGDGGEGFKTDREGLQALFWSLVNSSEFAINH
jgi:hypothetical protein